MSPFIKGLTVLTMFLSTFAIAAGCSTLDDQCLRRPDSEQCE